MSGHIIYGTYSLENYLCLLSIMQDNIEGIARLGHVLAGALATHATGCSVVKVALVHCPTPDVIHSSLLCVGGVIYTSATGALSWEIEKMAQAGPLSV